MSKTGSRLIPEVPADFFTAEEIKGWEDTMNATMRECVFATELLQSGDVTAALDALLQIRLNSEQITDQIEQRFASSQSGQSQPQTQPTRRSQSRGHTPAHESSKTSSGRSSR